MNEDLIKLLEQAKEGSAELDARLQALDYGEVFTKLDDGVRGASHPNDELSVCWIADSGKRYTCWRNKAYTRSIDASLTLIPEDYIYTLANDYGGLNRVRLYDGMKITTADGETMPLAICITCLKMMV